MRGVATVVLVTEPFEAVARSSAIARGFGKLPIVVLPADFDDLDDSRLRALVAQRLDEIEGALSRARA
jgi:hypothetical protein